jgi:hypothetical protein
LVNDSLNLFTSSFILPPSHLLFRLPLGGFEHLIDVNLIAFEGRREGVPERWFLNFSARFYSLKKGPRARLFEIQKVS